MRTVVGAHCTRLQAVPYVHLAKTQRSAFYLSFINLVLLSLFCFLYLCSVDTFKFYMQIVITPYKIFCQLLYFVPSRSSVCKVMT